MNQCDGCRRGLPLVGGIHRGAGYDLIGCTADRYADAPGKPSFPCPDLCRHCGSDVAICGEQLCIAPHRFQGPVL